MTEVSLPPPSEDQEILTPEPLQAVFVDDDSTIREMTRIMLEGEFDSFEVFETPNEVLERFQKENPPNVLLTDGDLGDGKITGLELVRQIKDRFSGITAVLISGGVKGVDMKNSEQLGKYGVDICLPKPVPHAKMLELPKSIRELRQQRTELPFLLK